MAAAALLGLGLCWTRLGDAIALLSYDTLLLFSPKASVPDILVVTMGEGAYNRLNQPYGKFDRKIHAQFLRKLKADGAKLVVFDIFFAESTESDEEFAQAIREHGNVVLGAQVEVLEHRAFAGSTRFGPAEKLRDLPGSRVGAVELPRDNDDVIRRFLPEINGLHSLAWASAELAGARLPANNASQGGWIRLYGENGSGIERMPYEFALEAAPSNFRDKVVFIGGKPEAVPFAESADIYPVGLTRWTGERLAGVEIHAAIFANLLRREWLGRLGSGEEAALIGIAGALVGGALGMMRPLPGLAVGAAAGGIAIAGTVAFTWSQHVWFNWLVIPLAQIPAAWLTALVLRARRAERELTQAQAPSAETLPTIKDDAGTNVLIRDYELIKCVGRGAYGEVWLARSVIGAFRAVKIVYKRNFADERPFEREFEGVRNFEPISRQHEGWVSILHVAKEENGSHFYYVMEPADDVTGGAIDPIEYQPKTLAALLHGRKRLPPAQVVDLGVKLADALAALHDRGLIHRDIKPSNIVFANGRPKLADIGLVVQAGHGQSFVGTEGYIPPEGPGTPLADIFSLGCVLFQAATGRNSPGRGGQLLTPEEAAAESGDMKMLLEVIDRACANFHGKRFQSAAEMRDHLAKIKEEEELHREHRAAQRATEKKQAG